MNAEEAKEKLGEELRSLKDEIMDCILKAVPPEVAEHLGNSTKELLKAIRALIDKEIEAIDKTVERAKKLHRQETSSK